jgi:hypothetical protein
MRCSRCGCHSLRPAHGAAPVVADDGRWQGQPITAAFNGTGHPALCLLTGVAANGMPPSLRITSAGPSPKPRYRGSAMPMNRRPNGIPAAHRRSVHDR